MRQISTDELKEILENHELWLEDKGGKRADLLDANLQGANLLDANLQGADLRKANLQGADLRMANLQDASLQGAVLRMANLQDADLRRASLQGADLRMANLQDADLQDVDWDHSCFPLWCGSFHMKADPSSSFKFFTTCAVLTCAMRKSSNGRKSNIH